MAERGGRKTKVNWEYIERNWSQNTETVNEKYKQDFAKSLGSFQKIMKIKNDKEKFNEAQNLFRSMRKEQTFQQFPEMIQREISDLFRDEEKDKSKESANTKKEGDLSQSQRSQAQDTYQGIDEGPAPKKTILNPQQSMRSPSQSRKQDEDKGSRDTKALQEKIEQLMTELTAVQKQSKERKTELDEQNKEVHMKEGEISDLTKRNDQLQEVRKKLEHEVGEKQKRIYTMEKQLENSYVEQHKLQDQLQRQINEFEGIKKKLNETMEDNLKLNKERKHLEKKHEGQMAALYETMADEKRKHDSEMLKLTRDRDDIRDRFSKLAGAKLSDQNADIADLSDPNRAMKLSEKFGQLYDDEWTNAFETLTEKKTGLSMKEAIAFLLRLLQDCWPFCNTLLTTQMESLHNVFLHPSQNMAKIDPRKNVGGLKDRPRIGSKEDKTLRELRRMIAVGPSVIEEVKQCFLSETKSWSKEKTGYDKKHIDACAPYIQKCAEVCWLMAVHDPPLYMKMDVKPGEKLDPNVYSVYSLSGNTIDFLVWPPLLNGKEGGLLAKGVAEPQKIVGKKK